MTSKSKSFTTETKLVRELAIIFDEKDLTELELETDDISIRLARSQSDQQIVTMPQQAVGPHAQHSANAVVSTPDAISEHSTNTTSSDFSAHEGAVLSPMVGTVYLAPEPGAADFINEGDVVKKGQTLFIVEAMKVMNEINAETSGEIVEILVENGTAVQFGEPLFRVKSA